MLFPPRSEAGCIGSSASPKSVLRPNLRASVWDAGFFGAMVGLGEAYLPAFALAIGMGEVLSGLVVSVPILIGGMAQLLSLIAMRWFRNDQRWIVAMVVLQGLTFVPLIVAAVQGSISAWWLFAIVALYWGTGMAGGPAWNSWITHMVPHAIRSNFFARRTRVIQFATLLGFLAAGAVLYVCNQQSIVLWGYASIFLLAAVSRWMSGLYLAWHRPLPNRWSDSLATFNPTKAGDWFRVDAQTRTGWRLVAYLACMQACIQFSGPYFVPYIFKRLEASYPIYVVLISTAIVAKIVALPMWGQVAQRYGRHRLMWIGGLGLVPLSSLWTLSDNLGWLIAVQLASGILYAAYELAFLLMFLGDIPQARRTSLLTLYNFANSAAWCVGSIAGGIYLASGAASYHSYHQLFLISGVGRLACLILLWRVLAPVPSGPSFRVAFPEDSPPLGEPRASEAAFAQRRIA